MIDRGSLTLLHFKTLLFSCWFILRVEAMKKQTHQYVRCAQTRQLTKRLQQRHLDINTLNNSRFVKYSKQTHPVSGHFRQILLNTVRTLSRSFHVHSRFFSKRVSNVMTFSLHRQLTLWRFPYIGSRFLPPTGCLVLAVNSSWCIVQMSLLEQNAVSLIQVLNAAGLPEELVYNFCFFVLL